MKPKLYDALGGIDGCRKLSAAFYGRVARDPILIPVFGSSFHCAVEALATYLTQFLEGPCVYSPQRWYLSLREAHRQFKFGQPERDAWMRNMQATLAQVEIGASERSALMEFFAKAATFLTNGERAPVEGPLASNWERQLALENAVAEVRAGHAPSMERLAPCFERDPMAHVGLLGTMIASGMLEPVRQQLAASPELVSARYVRGRTLLHDAAAAGCVPMVELLLKLGAPTDGALYQVGNACTAPTGGDVVRLLAKAGADVNVQERVKRCAPLHMAARRGNLPVAKALLDCGARLEVRDSLGETPLRRAVNCNKVEVAALLLARGADRHSIGSKGLTPIGAARTAVMKKIFEN
jgi:truncated hemoglobin YjbI